MPFDREPAHGYTYQGITIPDAIAAALTRWIDAGELPGDFLQAVLRNDLRESIGRASVSTRLALHAIVVYLYNEAPGPCWGSPEKVAAWAAKFARTHADFDLGGESGLLVSHENSVEAPEAGLLSNLPHD